MTTFIPIQTQARLTATFTNALTGALVDPTTVTLSLTDPGGNVSVVSGTDIVHDSTGIYHYDWTGNQAGNWTIRFQGTGTVVAASVPATVVLL